MAAPRSNKTTASVMAETFQTVQNVLRPPLPLKDEELTFFDWIVKSREATTWSKNDLVIACNLARTYQRLEMMHVMLGENYTQQNVKGTVEISNPLFAALTATQAQVQTLNRTLGLDAPQRGLAGDKQGARNAADNKARDVLERASEHDLL